MPKTKSWYYYYLDSESPIDSSFTCASIKGVIEAPFYLVFIIATTVLIFFVYYLKDAQYPDGVSLTTTDINQLFITFGPDFILAPTWVVLLLCQFSTKKFFFLILDSFFVAPFLIAQLAFLQNTQLSGMWYVMVFVQIWCAFPAFFIYYFDLEFRSFSMIALSIFIGGTCIFWVLLFIFIVFGIQLDSTTGSILALSAPYSVMVYELFSTMILLRAYPESNKNQYGLLYGCILGAMITNTTAQLANYVNFFSPKTEGDYSLLNITALTLETSYPVTFEYEYTSAELAFVVKWINDIIFKGGIWSGIIQPILTCIIMCYCRLCCCCCNIDDIVGSDYYGTESTILDEDQEAKNLTSQDIAVLWYRCGLFANIVCVFVSHFSVTGILDCDTQNINVQFIFLVLFAEIGVQMINYFLLSCCFPAQSASFNLKFNIQAVVVVLFAMHTVYLLTKQIFIGALAEACDGEIEFSEMLLTYYRNLQNLF